MSVPSPMNHGGILSGNNIRDAVKLGEIEIDPWQPSHLREEDRINPASYDLTLGNEVAVYQDVVIGNFHCDGKGEVAGERLFAKPYADRLIAGPRIDAAKPNSVIRHTLKPDEGLLLKPGIGYLMHTAERVKTDKYVPIVDGKSSIGRLFCFVHITAGYGDPGFDGQYTLEVAVIHPLVVYAGMRCCQIRFHTLVGEATTYQRKGNYRGKQMGAVESMAWKMFQKPE